MQISFATTASILALAVGTATAAKLDLRLTTVKRDPVAECIESKDCCFSTKGACKRQSKFLADTWLTCEFIKICPDLGVSWDQCTVPGGYLVATSQFEFLQLANLGTDIIYKVKRTFDGRTFLLRTVRAAQADDLLYITLVTFQNTKTPSGHVLQYQLSLPDLQGSHPDKDELLPYSDFLRSMMLPIRSSGNFDFDTDN
ncbi:hypothetical protein HJFPF1_09553 [Paramyrothecium foliicola]|nr:hypothetical protein HJFPF1_09553 [Paramyrothecium foliicola]